MNNLFSYSFTFIIIVTIIISIFSSSSMSSLDYSKFNINNEEITISENGYTWPIPR